MTREPPHGGYLDSSPPTPRLWKVWLAVFVGAAVLYGSTSQRGVSWQDSGDIQYRIVAGRDDNGLGIAAAHPLYIAGGRLMSAIPLGNVAWRLNFYSGLGMSLALANLAAVCLTLTGRVWIALATAAMLALAHTVWWLAVVAECYSWVAAGLTAEIWIMLQLMRQPSTLWVAALALVNGAGWANHNLALLSMPVYVAAILWLIHCRKLPPHCLAVALPCYLVGASPLLFLAGQHWLRGEAIMDVVASTLWGSFKEEVFGVGLRRQFLLVTSFLGSLNFLNLLLPAFVMAIPGLGRRVGRMTATMLLVLCAIHFAFFARYAVPDQFTFFVPTLFLMACVSSVGLLAIAERRPRLLAFGCIAAIVGSPVVYALLPRLIRVSSLEPMRERRLPYRDELSYWVVPWKWNESSAQRFADEALRSVPDDSIIVADPTAASALRAFQAIHGGAAHRDIISKNEITRLDPKERERLIRRLKQAEAFVVSPAEHHAPRDLLDGVERHKAGLLEKIAVRPSQPEIANTDL